MRSTSRPPLWVTAWCTECGAQLVVYRSERGRLLRGPLPWRCGHVADLVGVASEVSAGRPGTPVAGPVLGWADAA